MRVISNLVRSTLFLSRTILNGSRDSEINAARYSSLSSTKPPTLPDEILPTLAPQSRRLFLLRHGETDWNAQGLVQGGGYDIQLNIAGYQQAQCARDHLPANLPFNVIASSHLLRAAQTADTIARNYPNAVRVIVPKLGEMRFGEFEGLAVKGPDTNDTVLAKFQHWRTIMAQNKEIPWPGGGESIADVESRAQAGIRQLFRGFPQSTHFCVVAHGRTNKILISALLGVQESDVGIQGNTCINVLDMDADGRWYPRLLNYVEHVAGKDESVFG